MSIKLFTVDVSPKPDVNCDIAAYVIDNGNYLTLIETGPSNGLNRLLNWLESKGYSVDDIKYVLVTHIHLDHAGAAGHLIQQNQNIKIFVHPRGYKHLANPSKLWNASLDTIGYVAKIYGEPLPVPPENLIVPEDGYLLDIGNEAIRIIYTPGHASHHMSLFLERFKILFTGDSAGLYHYNTLIPTTPKPHNVEKSLNSLRKMMDLHPSKLAFTHYGIADNAIEKLEKYRIIYEKWVKIVEEGYKNGLDLDKIYKNLKKQDINANIQERFFKIRGYGEEEVMVSIFGILSYFEWISAKNRE